MTNEVHTYACAGGIVIDAGRVLLVRKRQVEEVRLPKGHIEPGESREAAAVRETTEETGYAELRPLADLGFLTVEFTRRGQRVIRIELFYLMALAGPGRQARAPDDAARFEPLWESLDAAEALLTFPSEQEFLRRARTAHREQTEA